MAAALVALLAGGDALAWPDKPVRVVVPFGPGGTTDQVARVFQRAIQEHKLLPQPVVVNNVGGHFSVGARQVLDAPPDGHTLLIMHIALMGGEASGVVNFGHQGFAPIASTSEFCLTPVVRDDSPFKSLKDLLTAAKDKPDSIVFGVNIAAINHMAALQMQNLVPGAKFRFVQVGGGAENFKALAGGHTQASVLSNAEYVGFKANGIRALGYTGPKRQAAIGDVPTLRELGYDMEFCVANWWFAPKGTPQSAIDGMATALERAIATDLVKKEMEQRLFEPVFLKGEAFARSLAATYAVIAPIAKEAAPKRN
jgi:tripartite-type tricarboxylate transporter receptor subunit TctC